MKITETEVRYVAALANLNLSDAEVLRFQSELSGILDHFDKLNEIDTTGVEPMAQVLFEGGASTESPGGPSLAGRGGATLRDDVPVPPLGNEAALDNAPQPGAGYFKVPKVIER